MRIIAGEHRGHRLLAPKGRGTRPTTDRVRESLMSALASARGGFADAYVLDAFAGSGALGLEALSRGAAFVHFFENDIAALRTLSANVELLGVCATGAQAQVRIHHADVLVNPPVWADPAFDLVFLDPPYALAPERVLALVVALANAGVLSSDALISYEHDASVLDIVDSVVLTCGLSLASRRRYGDTVVDLLQPYEQEIPTI